MTRPHFPFLDEMDGILISGEVGVGKPDAAIFREFIARFGIEPDRTVYIDDWDLNVATASGLGLVAIQFVGAAQLRAELRRLGVAVAPAPPA
jgi:2-haloacid dehalogenase